MWFCLDLPTQLLIRWLLRRKLRKNMPSIHTKMLHHFSTTLCVHHAERCGLSKRTRKNISVPRSMGREKKRKKGSPYLKKEIKDIVVQKRCEFQKHMRILIWLYDLFSPLGPVFDFVNKHASFSFPTLSCTKSLIRCRKTRGNAMLWWGIIHIEWSERVIWGAMLYFDLIWLFTMA
jgi:hypothetical protein